MKLSGDDKLEDNLYPLENINWAGIVDFTNTAEKTLADNGYPKVTFFAVDVEWSWQDGSLSLLVVAPAGNGMQARACMEIRKQAQSQKAMSQVL